MTIDASGLASDDSLSPEVSSGYGGRLDSGMASLDMQTAMSFLADETGGATIQGRNDLALALRGLEADWTAYYSLGYESRTRSPERRGRSRSPSQARRTGDDAAGRHREDTGAEGRRRGALGSPHPDVVNPLRASLHIGTPKKSGKLWLVPLEFKIPFDKLTLVPGAGRARGGSSSRPSPRRPRAGSRRSHRARAARHPRVRPRRARREDLHVRRDPQSAAGAHVFSTRSPTRSHC